MGKLNQEPAVAFAEVLRPTPSICPRLLTGRSGIMACLRKHAESESQGI